MSKANHNNLCSDAFFGSVFIKGKEVLDQQSNLKNVNKLVTREAKIKKDLTVLGDVYVKGDIQY